MLSGKKPAIEVMAALIIIEYFFILSFSLASTTSFDNSIIFLKASADETPCPIITLELIPKTGVPPYNS